MDRTCGMYLPTGRVSACLSVTRSLALSVDPRGSSRGSSLPSLLVVLAVDSSELYKTSGKGGQATRASA